MPRPATSMVRFDEYAEAFASDHPEYFLDHVVNPESTTGKGSVIDPEIGGSIEDRVWDIMLAGKQPLMSKEQSFEAAFNILKEKKDAGEYRRVKLRKPREEVPF